MYINAKKKQPKKQTCKSSRHISYRVDHKIERMWNKKSKTIRHGLAMIDGIAIKGK